MKKKIKSWLTGKVLYSAKAKNIKELLMSAIKSGVNLSYADLSGVDLSYADLSYAVLSHANLSHADLSDANLSYANLSYAVLYCAKLSCANLYRANLSGADLRGAILRGANLRGADLRDVNLSGADLYRASLSYANLSGASLDKKYSFLSISPIGSENGCLWTFRGEDGVLKLNRGCFSGTLPEFVEAVKEKHSGNKYERQYMAAIELIKTVLGVDEVDDTGTKEI